MVQVASQYSQLIILTTAFLGSAALSGSAPAELRCAPKVVQLSDTLVLTMSLPHHSELAVRHPDGTPFFLVYNPGRGVPIGWKPLISKAEFRAQRELRFKVSDLTGTPWVAGRDANERVFTIPGDYVFVLTEVLETDADYPTQTCKVRLAAAER